MRLCVSTDCWRPMTDEVLGLCDFHHGVMIAQRRRIRRYICKRCGVTFGTPSERVPSACPTCRRAERAG